MSVVRLSQRLLPLPLLAVLLFAQSAGIAEERKDREFQECPECPVMVGLPAGGFVMGSPPSESGRFKNEGPQHFVSIKAFALGKYDITSQEFLTFLKDTGYQPAACNAMLDMRWQSPGHGKAFPPFNAEPPRWPAVCLTRYLAWLNGKVRLAHPEASPREGGPYRLPSEAEWEYAARAGTTTARWWGDALGTGNANCNGCGSAWDNRLLAEVDSFSPNPFGLFNVLGNAWQWTADCWHPSYIGAPSDGSAWTEENCTEFVIRGGSWANLPVFIRSAARTESETGGEYDYASLTGFRVARDLP